MNKVRTMHANGMTIPQMAKELGYKESSMGVMLRQAGIRRKVDADDYLEQMIQMRSEGKTTKEISDATGLTMAWVSKKLVGAGCRKTINHDIPREPEIDESKLTYAKPRKAPEKVVEGGKRWIDMTEAVFDTPDIMSL